MRPYSTAWVCIFLCSLAVIWASLDMAAAFVAFWVGLVGWLVGRYWMEKDDLH